MGQREPGPLYVIQPPKKQLSKISKGLSPQKMHNF